MVNYLKNGKLPFSIFFVSIFIILTICPILKSSTLLTALFEAEVATKVYVYLVVLRGKSETDRVISECLVT